MNLVAIPEPTALLQSFFLKKIIVSAICIFGDIFHKRCALRLYEGREGERISKHGLRAPMSVASSKNQIAVRALAKQKFWRPEALLTSSSEFI